MAPNHKVHLLLPIENTASGAYLIKVTAFASLATEPPQILWTEETVEEVDGALGEQHLGQYLPHSTM